MVRVCRLLVTGGRPAFVVYFTSFHEYSFKEQPKVSGAHINVLDSPEGHIATLRLARGTSRYAYGDLLSVARRVQS